MRSSACPDGTGILAFPDVTARGAVCVRCMATCWSPSKLWPCVRSMATCWQFIRLACTQAGLTDRKFVCSVLKQFIENTAERKLRSCNSYNASGTQYSNVFFIEHPQLQCGTM